MRTHKLSYSRRHSSKSEGSIVYYVDARPPYAELHTRAELLAAAEEFARAIGPHARSAPYDTGGAIVLVDKRDHYAAIGSDGSRLVVWGLGTTPYTALTDALLQHGVTSEDLQIVPCTYGAAVRVRRGEISCECGALMLEGLVSTSDDWKAERLVTR